MESDRQKSTPFCQDDATQTCRCAQTPRTRSPYDSDDQSSGDNDSYYTDSSEYYRDEDGNYEAENDFSSEWSDDYSDALLEILDAFNDANETDLSGSETDDFQTQESGSLCRCYAWRTCRCRSLSPNHADAISEEEFQEFLSPNINYDFDTRSSNDSDSSSHEMTNRINRDQCQRNDINRADESGSSSCETTSYYTDE